ncbi:hypothetical protein [Streptacidiphilus pinicola]|nr:hypothetical protein [Streptacidiphilus pinicola]
MHGLFGLDGLSESDLQGRAHRWWQLLGQSPGCGAYLIAASCALVDLRRSGAAHYSVRDHARRQRVEISYLNRQLAQEAGKFALKADDRVRVLGEDRVGSVVYRMIGQDPGDPFPAAWYVIAMPGLLRCRAHGSDELERVHAHAPASDVAPVARR